VAKLFHSDGIKYYCGTLKYIMVLKFMYHCNYMVIIIIHYMHIVLFCVLK